ncbi:MAG: glucose-6-phosphate isomerase [Ignavibacteria bacterium]|nr:glucose-6-phosphate isomerase [Ignavibacteria bacterium]
MKLNIERVFDFIKKEDFYLLDDIAALSRDMILSGECPGNDFLGWVNLPSEIQKDLINSIKIAADELKKKSKVIVVIGIGGSYLGARAVIEALSHNFNHLRKSKEREKPLVLFAGQNIGEDYIIDLLEILDDKDYSIIVISKSGTTTEPAIAFRILKNHIYFKYGKEADIRIIAVTDERNGSLRKLSDAEGYRTFIIPDDVGGRFSVLTPVGLLPIACAGFDIEELLRGAADMRKSILDNKTLETNAALQYAAVRNFLYHGGKTIEILVNYSPSLHYLSEWWKQLFGESEGKDGKGIFPASADFTTDLHSLGQLIQDGKRNIIETVLWVENSGRSITIPFDEKNFDGLNYLLNRGLNDINKMAMLGTNMAHSDGKVPLLSIEIDKINEYNLGSLIYFFEFSCAVSGLMLGVNPFNQPGVEAYKKNMLELLGKA